MTGTDTSTHAPDTPPGGELEPFLLALSAKEEVVRSIVEPVLAQQQLELVMIQLNQNGPNAVLRLFIDTHDEKIGIADLERQNRELGDLLDVEDEHRGLFKGRYTLEVSSPGVDRPLTKRSHFDAKKGETIKVKTRIKVGDSKTHTGALAEVDDEGLVIRAEEDAPIRIGWRDLTQAHAVFQFEATQKPKPKRQKRNKKSS
jgi:ribosome maturation factor RimP